MALYSLVACKYCGATHYCSERFNPTGVYQIRCEACSRLVVFTLWSIVRWIYAGPRRRVPPGGRKTDEIGATAAGNG